MEVRKSNRIVWIVVAALLGLLIVVGISATVGGVAGYLAGRAASGSHIFLQQTPFEFHLGPLESTPETAPSIPQVPRGGMPDLQPFGELPLGALIMSVTEDSPAETAGLQVGDVITAIDGTSFKAEQDLVAMLANHAPGDTIELTLAGFADEAKSIKVTLGRHPDRGGETAYLGIGYRMVPVVGQGRTPFRGR